MSQDLYIVIGSWIIIVLAAERTTEIINDSKFFFPLRNWITIRSISGTWFRSLFLFMNDVVTCAWCLSVWVSMFFCWFLPGGYFELLAPDNILVKCIALVGASNLWHAIFRLVHRGRVITIDIKHTVVNGLEEEDDEDEDQDLDGELGELNIVIGDDDGEYRQGDSATEDGPE